MACHFNGSNGRCVIKGKTWKVLMIIGQYHYLDGTVLQQLVLTDILNATKLQKKIDYFLPESQVNSTSWFYIQFTLQLK